MPVPWLAIVALLLTAHAAFPFDHKAKAEAEVKLGNDARRHGNASQATSHYLQAFAYSRAAGDLALQAGILSLLSSQWTLANRFDEAVEACNAALPMARAVPDRTIEGRLLHNLGSALWSRGDPAGAQAAAEAALAIRRDLKDVFGIALGEGLLGNIAFTTGDLQGAALRFERAVRMWREQNVPAMVANALDGLGISYLATGDATRARQQHEASLALWTAQKNALGQGQALNNLGMAVHRQKHYAEAQAHFEKSLSLTTSDARSQAYTLHNLGHLAADQGRHRDAIALLTRSLEKATEIGDPFSGARSLYRIGLSQQRLHLLEARASLERALDQQQRSGDRDGASLTRTALASLALARGDQALAESLAAAAIATVESTRTGLASPDLRVTYLEAHSRQYGVWIDALLARGKVDEALHASERARARALLDGLAGWSPKLAPDDRKDLVARLVTAERELRARAAILSQPNLPAARRDTAERRLAESEARYQETRALLRASADAPAFDPPEPLHPAAIRALLGRDTAAVAFWINETQSVAWVITAQSVRLVRLPAAEPLQRLTSTLHAAHTARAAVLPNESLDARAKRLEAAARSGEAAAGDLSRILLAPLLTGLRQSRLAIVAAGPLHALPWAALPFGGKPLLATREVVLLPSLSALDSIRKRHPQPAAAWRAAAIVDPVYREPYPPLPHTRREAAAIPNATLVAGLDASPAALNLPNLRQANLLHFGVHADVNASQPQLSSLVLSLRDAAGLPKDGFLRQYDIHDMRLPAELIVLSACRSADGPEAQGEGVLGLTRAFLYGGAARVVASLWSVDDQATAELMTRFYQGLYRQHLTPARALRQAQLALAATPRWSAPEYWAAFQLYGEFR
ncbi:MAG: CHAT domain-containing protein [Bryobacterales bacterium]|nr:CHAT domain-containing protein [Bryobacterales bacterium]